MTGAGFARDRGFVDRGRAFDDVAVARDQLVRLDADQIALAQFVRVDHHGVAAHHLARLRVRLRTPKEVRLRFTATLGDRFREVREDYGEPEPQRDREIESGDAGRLVVHDHVAHEEKRRDERAHLDDEHHRVARLPTRIQLRERIGDGARDDRPIEERARLGPAVDATGRDHTRIAFLAAFGDVRRWGRGRRRARRSARRR